MDLLFEGDVKIVSCEEVEVTFFLDMVRMLSIILGYLLFIRFVSLFVAGDMTLRIHMSLEKIEVKLPSCWHELSQKNNKVIGFY